MNHFGKVTVNVLINADWARESVSSEGRGKRQMDVRQEIARRVEKLPPESQEQVLRFVASLPASAPAGEKGARLRQFSSSLDSVSARQMIQAIEEGCEQVDAGEW